VQVAQGDTTQIAALDAHDTHFTFAENIGAPDCDIPVERYRWLPTRQPIVLDFWEHDQPLNQTYRTITTWHNKDKDVTYRGETYYWTKDREFAKFLDLPRRSSARFELAADGVDATTRHCLLDHGWRQIDPAAVSRDANRYRAYIQNSRGEFTVARDQYVRPRTGWFSDRSACFLAASRPVITQETGFSKFLPTGMGLFAFETIEDVLAAVQDIDRDEKGHRRAAREVAAEYFSAERVLGSLMDRAGL
jgi:hypothetical protein